MVICVVYVEVSFVQLSISSVSLEADLLYHFLFKMSCVQHEMLNYQYFTLQYSKNESICNYMQAFDACFICNMLIMLSNGQVSM